MQTQKNETAEAERPELRFQDLLQGVTDYAIAINRKYQIITANDRFKKEFDVYSSPLCHKAWKRRDEKCEKCPVEKSFQDGEVHMAEESVILKDGRVAQLLVKSTPIKNGRGEVAYVLETGTDITEKKRLEEELKRVKGHLEELLEDRVGRLRESEERYRTIFEYSRDAMTLTDPKGKIIEINRPGIEVLGYPSKEEVLAGGSIEGLFENPDEFARFQETISRDGFAKEFSARLVGKGDRSFDALMTSSVVINGKGEIAGYVIIIRDITRAKEAQEQIQRQNTRLTALNAVAMTVSSSLELREVLSHTIENIRKVLGSDTIRIYLVNQKGDRLDLVAHAGLSSEFVEKEHVKSRAVSDGMLGMTFQTGLCSVVDNVQRSGAPYVEFLISEGFKSTSYIPLLSKGQPLGVMAVSSRSAFKFSSDYLQFLTAIGYQIGMAVANANLYENLKRAYEELKQAQEQVLQAEKLASLGKMAATIAHEINNPIAIILTYIRLMAKLVERQRFTPERLGDISRYLSTMESETSRCGEIVKNLLAFSRQSSVTFGSHSIEEIVQKTVTLISHDLELREIRLIMEMPTEPLPKIMCDFKQIQQALLNLTVNASEAMERGGILTIGGRFLEALGMVEVSISDTGCGILEENVKRIFEPFFTTKEEGKGVGLGLSVVYGIITRHNGTIDVKTELGKGTVFTIRLPVAK